MDKVKDTNYLAPDVYLTFKKDKTIEYEVPIDITKYPNNTYTHPDCFFLKLKYPTGSTMTWDFDTRKKENLIISIDGAKRSYAIKSLTKQSFIIEYETDAVKEKYVF